MLIVTLPLALVLSDVDTNTSPLEDPAPEDNDSTPPSPEDMPALSCSAVPAPEPERPMSKEMPPLLPASAWPDRSTTLPDTDELALPVITLTSPLTAELAVETDTSPLCSSLEPEPSTTAPEALPAPDTSDTLPLSALLLPPLRRARDPLPPVESPDSTVIVPEMPSVAVPDATVTSPLDTLCADATLTEPLAEVVDVPLVTDT